MTKPIIMSLLKKMADNMEIRYMSPVYLVGSFQHKYEEAHDIDIIIVFTEDRMKRLFGDTKFNDKQVSWRWKQKLEWEETIYQFDIDIKPQTQAQFDGYKDKPHTKLGSYAHCPE